MQASGTQIIETQRLYLRPFCQSDTLAMYQNWASQPENLTYLTWPAHPDLSVTQACLTSWVSQYEKGDFFKWAITEQNQRQTVIGDMSVVKLDKRTNACSIGYVLGQAFWGQGYMTEALQAVIRYLLMEADFNRIEASHDTCNPASGKVMLKAGMTYEGTLRQAGYNNRGIVDVSYYSILQQDFLRK